MNSYSLLLFYLLQQTIDQTTSRNLSGLHWLQTISIWLMYHNQRLTTGFTLVQIHSSLSLSNFLFGFFGRYWHRTTNNWRNNVDSLQLDYFQFFTLVLPKIHRSPISVIVNGTLAIYGQHNIERFRIRIVLLPINATIQLLYGFNFYSCRYFDTTYNRHAPSRLREWGSHYTDTGGFVWIHTTDTSKVTNDINIIFQNV